MDTGLSESGLPLLEILLPQNLKSDSLGPELSISQRGAHGTEVLVTGKSLVPLEVALKIGLGLRCLS